MVVVKQVASSMACRSGAPSTSAAAASLSLSPPSDPISSSSIDSKLHFKSITIKSIIRTANEQRSTSAAAAHHADVLSRRG